MHTTPITEAVQTHAAPATRAASLRTSPLRAFLLRLLRAARAQAQPCEEQPRDAQSHEGQPRMEQPLKEQPQKAQPQQPPPRHRIATFLASLALALAAFAHPGFLRAAHAGQACSEVQPTPEHIRAGLNLALQTRQALEASGAQVAMVARVGQDLSRYGLRYSHMAWAWRDHPKGRWFVVHELNACGTANSELYDEGLGNFFLTDLVAYDALLVIPPPEAQARLAAQLARDRALTMHQPRYNMVAYPFATRYQNSNQWAAETLAAALAPENSIGDRASAQAWLKQNGFTPTTLNLSTFTRLGGRMFRANVAFDDHPDERRFAGRIDTTTVESVARFLEARGAKSQVLSLAK